MAMQSTESSAAKSSSNAPADASVPSRAEAAPDKAAAKSSPAETAPAKAALSILGAITAALVAVAVAVSHNTHDNTPRLDPRYCEGGLRPRPSSSWALSQPRRFAPESPRDGAPPVCSAIPPVRGAYPTTRKLEDIVASWPINDTRIPENAPIGGLCRFDWSKAEDRLKALAYRRAEVPFQVFNVPSLDAAVQRWSSDEYVGNMWHGPATAEVSTFPNGEFAHGPNHFMFHAGSSSRAPTTSRSTTLSRWLARDGGPPEYLSFEVPYAHGGIDRRGGGARGESVLHGELPLFDAAVQTDEARFFAPSEELCGNQPVFWVLWLRRAVRNRHCHTIEQVSRRWRGGRRGDSGLTRRKFDSTRATTSCACSGVAVLPVPIAQTGS